MEKAHYLAGGKLKAYGITIVLLPVGACSIVWWADGINYSVSLKTAYVVS